MSQRCNLCFCRNFVVSTVSSTVIYVNAQKGVPEVLLNDNCEPVRAMACHPKRPTVVLCSQSGVLKVWDYTHKLTVCSRNLETERQIQCVTFDPQGELVLYQELLHVPQFAP